MEIMEKNKSKIFFILGLAGVMAATMVFLSSQLKTSKKPAGILSAVDFVKTELINAEGILETYPFKVPHKDWPKGYTREALSESAGLWLESLEMLNDKENFEKQFQVLKKFFILPDGTLSWRLRYENEKWVADPHSATIDDLRIVRALIAAADKWNIPGYKDFALKLAHAVKESGVYQDFLLIQTLNKGEWEGPFIIDLSYLDLKTMNALMAYDEEWKPIYERSQALLIGGMRQNGFIYDKYDVQKNHYYDQDRNLINYLICASRLAESNFSVYSLIEQLIRRWQQDGKILGRYDPETGKPLVAYESVSVYALVMRLSLIMKQWEFARVIRDKILELSRKQTSSHWQGALCDDACHAFDHLQALASLNLAEKEKL